MNRRDRKMARALLLLAATILLQAVTPGAGQGREPQVLPEVGDTFQAPYDAVWDATLAIANAPGHATSHVQL